MPTNNGRDPIVDGDAVEQKPKRKMVPEYTERRENKWAPRPFCRAQRKPMDPESAGATSTDMGKRRIWTSHFQKFKPARHIDPNHQPQDGKFKEFRPSRAFGPTSHILQKTTPILQNDSRYEGPERPQVRTFKEALRRSDPETDEMKWRNSRRGVKHQSTLKSCIPGLSKDENQGGSYDLRPLSRKGAANSATHKSSKGLFEYNHSGGISDKNEINERIKNQKQHEQQLQGYYQSNNSRQKAYDSRSHLRSSVP